MARRVHLGVRQQAEVQRWTNYLPIPDLPTVTFAVPLEPEPLTLLGSLPERKSPPGIVPFLTKELTFFPAILPITYLSCRLIS